MGQSAPSLSPTMVSYDEKIKMRMKTKKVHRSRLGLHRKDGFHFCHPATRNVFSYSTANDVTCLCLLLITSTLGRRYRFVMLASANDTGTLLIGFAAVVNLQCVLSVHRVSTFIITLCTNTSPYRVYTTADL